MKTTYIRLAASACYLVSFFLPAVRFAGEADKDAFIGWQCAWIASVLGTKQLELFLRGGFSAKELLLPMSGLVNYLFLALCVLSFWPRFRRMRIVLGALMLPCFAATWILFTISRMKPLAGHFLWIGACILVVIPDAVNALRKNAGAGAAAPDQIGGIQAS